MKGGRPINLSFGRLPGSHTKNIMAKHLANRREFPGRRATRLLIVCVLIAACLIQSTRSFRQRITHRYGILHTSSHDFVHLLADVCVNGEWIEMLIDTGDTTTVVDKQSIKAASSPSGSPQPSTIILGPRKSLIPFRTVDIGQDQYHPFPSRLCLDFFENGSKDGPCRLTIDGKRHELIIDNDGSREPYSVGSAGIQVPFIRDNYGRLRITASINSGSERSFVVDTGSQYDVLLQNRIPEVPAMEGGLDGTPVGLHVQGHSLRTSLLVIPFGKDVPPVIGLPFLLQYRTTIDFRDRMLYLEPFSG